MLRVEKQRLPAHDSVKPLKIMSRRSICRSKEFWVTKREFPVPDITVIQTRNETFQQNLNYRDRSPSPLAACR
jgi:hypothetical protein